MPEEKAMNAVIEVRDLHKSYGTVQAVRGVSFTVQAGEIFGMVGPNGAGKTTTIECLEGLRRPDSGDVRVLGQVPHQAGRALQQRIGVQLQQSALPPRLKVWEACDLFASFYQKHVPWQPLLEQFGLAEKRNAFVGKLSGGQQQRLHIVLALLNDPEVVFLDELTTGLDPQARHAMWDMVRDIRSRGKTVFLTTHFMEEAERLCDRVAVMDAGKIIALDTPEGLTRALEGQVSIVCTVSGGDVPLEELRALRGVEQVTLSGARLEITGRGDALLPQVVALLSARGLTIRDMRTEQPGLEDAFLALTGHQVRV